MGVSPISCACACSIHGERVAVARKTAGRNERGDLFMKLSSLSEAHRAGVALPRSTDPNYCEFEPAVLESEFKTISDISLVSGSINMTRASRTAVPLLREPDQRRCREVTAQSW